MILTSDISKIQTFPRFFLFYPKNQKKTIEIQKIQKNNESDSVKIFGFLDLPVFADTRTVCINLYFNPGALSMNFLHKAWALFTSTPINT